MTGTELHKVERPRRVSDHGQIIQSIVDLDSFDPTIIKSLQQIRGCDKVFARHIKVHGLSDFIRSMYVYILQRGADKDGLKTYGGLLRAGKITTYDLASILGDSEEFLSRPRLLAAPITPSFPFYF